MVRIEPFGAEKESMRFNKVFKYAAVLTMPLEGFFFFGIVLGWPNLAELYKRQGVYSQVCQSMNRKGFFSFFLVCKSWTLSS